MTARDASLATDALAEARRVIATEARAVAALAERLDGGFTGAVDAIISAQGRVIVSAIGKSGIIGRKIAGTLTSTGTPAFYLHPVEAMHGDLGIVSDADIALMISKSGESDELRGLVEFFSRTGVQIIAMTGSRNSFLARQAQHVIDCGVDEEACPHDLAPTSSTTATLVAGDALALALLERRGFGPDDFARIHPGGALGRKLVIRVADVMLTDDLPKLGPEASMRQCVVMLARQRGTVAVTDEAGRVTGVVTAGDLTRLMESGAEFLDVKVEEVMTSDPRIATADELGATAVGRMERHGIMALPVVDGGGVLVGMIHLHDLMRAGAV